MKKNYTLLVALCLMLVNTFAQTGPIDDGTVVETENFDGLDASTYTFNFDQFYPGYSSALFQNTVQITSAADIAGTGQGIQFYYDPNEFVDEEVTLHTFTNVAPGSYIIQYDIKVDQIGFSYESGINATANSYQYVDINAANTFRKAFTQQVTLSATGNISFSMLMSPFISAFTPANVYIDNVELIKMNDPLPATVAGSSVIQTEDFNAASTAPNATGSTSFVNNVILSAASDFAGAGQGVEFRYTSFNAEAVETIDLATFSSVPAGNYYITYQVNFRSLGSIPANYLSEISDGSTTALNYIVEDTGNSFVTHRTQSINTSSTQDINLRFIASPLYNSTFISTITYIDNVKLILDPTLSTNTFEKLNIVAHPNPATTSITISGLKEKENYTVYNVLGEQVLKGLTTNNSPINIQSLSNGMYFLKLKNQKTIKFLKE